jgi:hypothetical protein
MTDGATSPLPRHMTLSAVGVDRSFLPLSGQPIADLP